MFQFDKATLPQLTTRKALIVVDLQNDFISPDGALTITKPDGFVSRSLDLIEIFRSAGDVVWAQSMFESVRPVDNDRLVVSDGPSTPQMKTIGASMSLSKEQQPDGTADAEQSPDPEAFLSHEPPRCVEQGSSGFELPPMVKQAFKKGDILLKKSSYSAFEGTQLLRTLRAKMVMELFICGSLTNVGVYATAMDAAGHGMSITIIEDCCGYRNENRQLLAIERLIDLTGCTVASYEEVSNPIRERLEKRSTAAIKDIPKPTTKLPDKTSDAREESRTVAATTTTDPLDMIQSMSNLRLESKSPTQVRPPEVDESETASSILLKSDEAEPSGVSLQRDSCSSDNGPTESPSTIGGSVVPARRQTEKQGDEEEKLSSEGPGNDSSQRGLCEGDTDIIENLLPKHLEDGIFERLRDEVKWQSMSHQGGEVPRLIAVQGELQDDGTLPVYRHPSDESPPLSRFSKTVLTIKAETEKHLGHPLNHVLIQYYRTGNDYISEHSDKTLDIVPGSFIANVSLGAERTMVLRTKRLDKDHTRSGPLPEDLKRKVQRARLSHNSLCRMGLKTNMKWLHSIRQDKRADREKSSAELAFGGARISLTFRQIGTFLNEEESLIWGQGARGKRKEDAHEVINGQTPEAIDMLRAFGTENHSSGFDWDAYYGKGFDVLHMKAAPRFFASSDPIVNMRIALLLAEKGIKYAKGSSGSQPLSTEDYSTSLLDTSVKFVDNDDAKSTVEGELAILLYIAARDDKKHGTARSDSALLYTRLQQGLSFLPVWRRLDPSELKAATSPSKVPKTLRRDLRTWNDRISQAEEKYGEKSFVAGVQPSLADFALWPVLHDIFEKCGEGSFDDLDALEEYYQRFKTRPFAEKVFGKTRTSP